MHVGNDDWDDAPSSKPARSIKATNNNDGWDDDPKPSNSRQNGKFYSLYSFHGSVKMFALEKCFSHVVEKRG